MSIILLFLHLSPLARPRPVNFILLWLDFLFNYEGRGRQYLKVITALLIGHPITKDVVGSRVTSETSEMQLESQTSERGTCNEGNRLVMTQSTSVHTIKRTENWDLLKAAESFQFCHEFCRLNWHSNSVQTRYLGPDRLWSFVAKLRQISSLAVSAECHFLHRFKSPAWDKIESSLWLMRQDTLATIATDAVLSGMK